MGLGCRKYLRRNFIIKIFGIKNLCTVVQTIFSIDYYCIPCSTKKSGSKKTFHLGDQFTQTQRRWQKIWQNLTEKFAKNIFSKIQWKFWKIKILNFSKKHRFFPKNPKFRFSKFLLNFRKMFVENFSSIFLDQATLYLPSILYPTLYWNLQGHQVWLVSLVKHDHQEIPLKVLGGCYFWFEIRAQNLLQGA